MGESAGQESRREGEVDVGSTSESDRVLEPWPGPPAVGRWRVGRMFGAGGSGRVYHGTGPDGRAVAIKLRPMLRGERDRRRFAREAGAMRKLDHPNVLGILDAGLLAGSTVAPVDDETCDPDAAWLVMPLIEGGTLRERLAEGPLTESEVLELGLALAEAVAALHAAGILHRDIKPGNVLFQDGRPLLADFGLSRDAGRGTRMTRQGQFLGTVGYVSPEQARGKLDATDERTDIFGLGATLFEAVAGCSPFEASLRSGGLPAEGLNPRQELERLIDFLSSPPRPPSSVIGAPLPRLDPICRRCLEPEPAARYREAEDLADALAGALGRTRSRRRRGLGERLRGWLGGLLGRG